MKEAFWTLVLLVVLAAAAYIAFLYSGAYSVAATDPDPAIVRWSLETARDRFIHDRAAKVDVPPLDTFSEESGLEHYHAMCVTCHGAPGVEPSSIGKGLNPEPPDLVAAATERGVAELFWVIKNGIKMTGMPAFAESHSDDDIWEITAFVRRLPGIAPDAYEEKVAALGLDLYAHDHHKHGHAEGEEGAEHHEDDTQLESLEPGSEDDQNEENQIEPVQDVEEHRQSEDSAQEPTPSG